MKLSIAIPDSSLKDEKKHENKTRKIFQIARAAGIFQINNIIIYKDGREFENDSKLLSTILRYLETPQHFRKRLYPKSGLLQFVGALSPIKMPNQTGISDARQVKTGDVREGVIFPKDGKKYIDLGIDYSIPYHGKKGIDKRVKYVTEMLSSERWTKKSPLIKDQNLQIYVDNEYQKYLETVETKELYWK